MRLVLDAHHEDEDGDEEKFKAAESAIKKINGLVKKSIGDFRVLLRTAIAKIIGGSVSADDLMTIGSMAFKEFSLVPGAFQGEDSFDSPCWISPKVSSGRNGSTLASHGNLPIASFRLSRRRNSLRANSKNCATCSPRVPKPSEDASRRFQKPISSSN